MYRTLLHITDKIPMPVNGIDAAYARQGTKVKRVLAGDGQPAVADTFQPDAPEFGAAVAFIEQEAGNTAGAVFNDQLRCVADIIDAYAVRTDLINVLGLRSP